jgi:hypothetical protein
MIDSIYKYIQIQKPPTCQTYLIKCALSNIILTHKKSHNSQQSETTRVSLYQYIPEELCQLYLRKRTVSSMIY